MDVHDKIPERRDPDVPAKVTIPWLMRNVSIGFWGAAGGLVIAIFGAGAGFGQTTLFERS